MTTALIRATDLTVSHPGADLPVLSHVDMHIDPAEIVTVVGPNGSGKSTLVRAMLGQVALAGGRVERLRGLRIGYVPQRVHIERAMPMTVRRFLSLPIRVTDAQAAAVLERTGVPGLEGRQIVSLSGGQFQRVLLARGLLNHPQLLVLDEPTQGLDQPGIVAFYKLIEEVRAETGAAVLMVSHDLLVVMRGPGLSCPLWRGLAGHAGALPPSPRSRPRPCDGSCPRPGLRPRPSPPPSSLRHRCLTIS